MPTPTKNTFLSSTIDPLTLALSILSLFYLLVLFLFIKKLDPLTLAFSILFLFYPLVYFLFIKKTRPSNANSLYSISILSTFLFIY